MTWLDNLIGWLSPETGYRRDAFRRAMEAERNYDAASYKRPNSNWRVINDSAEMTDRYYRDTVRARARDLERNSDIMNAVIGAYRRNVYGGGYRLRAASRDENVNKQLESLWKIWCKKQNCDVTGMQSLDAIMRMAIQRKKVDGGIFFIKRYVAGGLLPFKLQMLEVDELDTVNTTPKHKGNKVVGGIEYNPWNRPVGYFFRQYSIDGMENVEPVYLEAKDVIFYFTKKRPSQIRELSDAAPTITRIRDANEFMTAVAIKERILSCLSVFIKRDKPPSGFGNTRQGTSGPKDKSTDYGGKTVSPGMIMNMNPGDEAQFLNPSGQATDASAYIKQELRLIGSGQGLSYETTSRDMSESNYSSARQGMIEDELTYIEDREQILEILDEIYETFVISCVLTGRIDLPDFWEDKERYLLHTWIKAPKRWIDPLKEANANKIALYTGQKSWADMAAESGKDWKELIDEMGQILEYGKEKGLDMESVMFGKKVGGESSDGK